MERRFAGVLIGVGPDLRYVTGFAASRWSASPSWSSRRRGPGYRSSWPHLGPRRGAPTPAVVRGGLAEVIPFDETDGRCALVADLFRPPGQLASRRRPALGSPIGLSDRLWAMHVLALQAVLPARKFEPASAVMRDLRQVRTPTRRDSCRWPQRPRTAPWIHRVPGGSVGRTEAEISRRDPRPPESTRATPGRLRHRRLRAEQCIPHHDAPIGSSWAGEPIVLDIGGNPGRLLQRYDPDRLGRGEAGVAPKPNSCASSNWCARRRRKSDGCRQAGVPAEQVDAAAARSSPRRLR